MGAAGAVGPGGGVGAVVVGHCGGVEGVGDGGVGGGIGDGLAGEGEPIDVVGADEDGGIHVAVEEAAEAAANCLSGEDAESFLAGLWRDGSGELEGDPPAVAEGDDGVGIAAEGVAVEVGIFEADGGDAGAAGTGGEGPIVEVVTGLRVGSCSAE